MEKEKKAPNIPNSSTQIELLFIFDIGPYFPLIIYTSILFSDVHWQGLDFLICKVDCICVCGGRLANLKHDSANSKILTKSKCVLVEILIA